MRVGQAVLLAAAIVVPFAPSAAASPQTAPAATAIPSSAKVIRDPDEYNAYVKASNVTDPTARATAFEDFVAKYPHSVVEVDALEQIMAAYQQLANQAKVLETAERILDVDAEDVRALAIVTFIRRAQATAGDASALAEMRSDAQFGAQNLAKWKKPAGLSDADFATLHDQMASIFQGALGFAFIQSHDYAQARTHLLQAVRIDANNIQDVYQLGIADLEMKPLDPSGLWYIAKAADLTGTQSGTARAAIEKYGRAQYARYHGSESGWDDLVARVHEQSVPPADFAHTLKRALSPAQLAVQAVHENDPASLSFSDWEFVLSYKDASPANAEAANAVWLAILTKEKHGAARLRLPVKIIAASASTLRAAVTDENQHSNTADLQVGLDKPPAHPPAVGSTVNVTGVITNYTAKPFLFFMEHGEIAKD